MLLQELCNLHCFLNCVFISAVKLHNIEPSCYSFASTTSLNSFHNKYRINPASEEVFAAEIDLNLIVTQAYKHGSGGREKWGVTRGEGVVNGEVTCRSAIVLRSDLTGRLTTPHTLDKALLITVSGDTHLSSS